MGLSLPGKRHKSFKKYHCWSYSEIKRKKNMSVISKAKKMVWKKLRTILAALFPSTKSPLLREP